MRTTAVAAVLASVVLAGCSIGGSVDSTPPASLTTAAAVPGPAVASCSDPGEDLIVRYQAPGTATVAQRLGSYCGSTVQQISSTAPTGAGFCTWMASATDNPGYDDGATPAAPLKNVIAAVGGGC